MASWQPRDMGEHREAPAGRASAGADGEAPWGLGGGAAPRLPDPTGYDAGIRGSAQRSVEEPLQARTPLGARRRADRPAAVAARREVQARLELGDDHTGTYMRDAIERGGYRAALEYYGGSEAKKSNTPWHRLRARGWLLGRLGLYGRMSGWLEEASEWDDFDHVLAAAGSVQRAAYRAPALWLQTPKPVPRSAEHLLTLEPAAAACRDTGDVPNCIWTAMLILDAVGPICSHAGLGAAAFLVATGADKRARGAAHGGGRYDPRRGARLHGAPEGCHRWIIADIDFDPWPVNEPHYYYDLTDEGRGALAAARAAGAPWPKTVEAAASGLGDADLPDLLESACGLGGPARDLEKTGGELGNLVDAWNAQERGRDMPPVSAGDEALVDLGSIAKWPDTGDSLGSAMDHFLYLMTVVDSTRSIACEAEPSTRAEGAVLRTLVAAIQDMCRRHGGAVAATAPAAGVAAARPVRGDPPGQEEYTRRPPVYTDAAPAMISDLYYCLAEYCGSRRLAADPCSLPPSKSFTDEETDAVIEALKEDSLYSEVG